MRRSSWAATGGPRSAWTTTAYRAGTLLIVRDGEDYVIKDLNSRNGTWVEGRRVFAEKLRHNDCILAGRTQFVFADPPVAARSTAQALTGPHGTQILQPHRRLQDSFAGSGEWEAHLPGLCQARRPQILPEREMRSRSTWKQFPSGFGASAIAVPHSRSEWRRQGSAAEPAAIQFRRRPAPCIPAAGRRPRYRRSSSYRARGQEHDGFEV